MNTRYDELNCHDQCSHHNFKHNEYPEVYTSEFIKRYGEKEYLDLVERSKKIKQWSIPELESLIKHYKSKLK